MAGKDLERTRIMGAHEYPRGTKFLVGSRADVDEVVRTGHVQTVGRYTRTPTGQTAVPVIYVSKRAQPFVIRHRWSLIIAGTVLILASAVTWVVLAVGLGWLVFGVAVSALALAVLSRISRGGRHRSVSVTTITKVNVR